MKVVIVGAGLSGLATAIALRKYVTQTSCEITIYEKPDRKITPEQARKQGEGLGLQSNGLRVLESFSPALKDKVYASGFPCDHFKWMTQGGVLIGREHVDVLPISRPYLIECLMGELPSDMVRYKTVSGIQIEDGKRPIVQFGDGSPAEISDLVIGADGVGSIVRKAMFGDEKLYQPVYSGNSAVGGVLEIPLPKHLQDDPAMIFVLGSQGNCGYTGLTKSDKNKLLFWSIWKTALPPRDQITDFEDVKEQLRSRHHDWPDPIIQRCIDQAEINNVYPIFVMPELPYWGHAGCVLVGDAAHALPPRSGQGTSQAFEDAQALALLLGKRLESNNTTIAVDKAVRDLYNLRHERVYNIRRKALLLGDPSMPMPQWKLYMFYAVLFLVVRINNFLSYFKSLESWDAHAEVERYLGTAD